MVHLQNIIDDFNEAIADLAVVWQEQRSCFIDSKTEQFGSNILRPVSSAGARINIQAEQLNAAIKKLAGCGLIICY